MTQDKDILHLNVIYLPNACRTALENLHAEEHRARFIWQVRSGAQKTTTFELPVFTELIRPWEPRKAKQRPEGSWSHKIKSQGCRPDTQSDISFSVFVLGQSAKRASFSVCCILAAIPFERKGSTSCCAHSKRSVLMLGGITKIFYHGN